MPYTQEEINFLTTLKSQGVSKEDAFSRLNAAKSIIQKEESPSFLQRAGSAITSIPSIAKAGVEKVSAGVSDIGGAFKPETFVAREGEDQMVSPEIAGKRSLLNRLEQVGQGLQRIGAGGLTTAFGVTPVGAGVSAGFGAVEPEVKKVVGSQPIQTIMNKFDMLPEDVQEAVVNLAESLPFAPKQAQQALKTGVQQTAKAAKTVATLPVTATVEALGKTTGAGSEAIREAFKQSAQQAPEFKKALRGEITPEQTLGEAKEALSKVKDSRKALYGEDYAKVEANKTPLDIEDVRQSFLKTLDDNQIKVEKTDTGLKLNFDESKLRKSSQGKVELQDTFDDLMTWKDTTPSGLDILKQRIREGYKGATDTGLSDKIHTQYANEVKNKIVKEVPEYQKMSETYEALTREIEDITKTLSLGSKANAQTAITKLSSALRENFPFRKDMVDLLEQYSGTNLKGQIAGQQLNPMLAKGLAGVITGGGLIFGQLANPAFWSGLALASPRLIGEVANAIGMPINAVKNGIKAIKESISKSVPNNVNANTVKNPIQGNKVNLFQSISQKSSKVKPLEKKEVRYESNVKIPNPVYTINGKKYLVDESTINGESIVNAKDESTRKALILQWRNTDAVKEINNL